jgi:hypothetical protein
MSARLADPQVRRVAASAEAIRALDPALADRLTMALDLREG